MRVILAGCEGPGIQEALSVEIVELCSTCALIVLASNSRPSLLGLVQVANTCANLFSRFWGIRIFLSELFHI